MIKLSFLSLITIFSFQVLLSSAQAEERNSPENFLNDIFRKKQEIPLRAETKAATPLMNFYTPPASPPVQTSTHSQELRVTLPQKNLSEEWDDVEKKDVDRILKKNGTSVLVIKNPKQRVTQNVFSSIASFYQTAKNLVTTAFNE